MSLLASWPLQQAVHAVLVADGSLAALVGARIYDRPPQDVAFPYVTLGDTDMTPERAEDTDASRHMVSVLVWSRANGRREAKEILAAIATALTGTPLSVSGHHVTSADWVRASLAYDRDADALKGELRVSIFTEPLA